MHTISYDIAILSSPARAFCAVVTLCCGLDQRSWISVVVDQVRQITVVRNGLGLVADQRM